MIGFDQMRRAMRLALELRDFIPGTESQCRHFLANVGVMVGAYVSMSLELEGVPHATTIVRAYDQGWPDDTTRRYLTAYVSAQAHRKDPSVPAINSAARPGHVLTRGRRQLVEDKIWYRSEQVDEYRRPAGIDDFIYSMLVGPRTSRCLSIHRPWNDKPFSDEERTLVHVLHAECAPLLEKRAPT
jgi:hypothetical protein